MSNYINENIPKNSTVLIEASVIGQSLIPYLDENYSLYDIAYNEYVNCANVAYDSSKISVALSDISSYSGNYLIICNNIVTLENCEFIYSSSPAMVNESFTLYFIP